MDKRLGLFLFALSIVLSLRLFLFYSQRTQYKDGQTISFVTTVSSDPKFSGNYQNFSVNLPTGEIVFIQTAGYPEYAYGDRLSVSGSLKVKLPNSNSPFFSLSFPKISLENPPISGLAVVYLIRQRIISSFQNTLPKDSSALLLGIVFGIKQDFSKEFLANFKTVGVMHVIAASGMNVTMVAGFLFYVFGLLFRRQVSIFLSIFGLIFYDFLAGFQSSIIRASIMGILAFSAQILGKQKDAVYILFLTGFIMLLWQPNFLTDVGFQLSFASTLGILIIPRLLKRWENGFSADLITTLSAQAASLPVLISTFGSYSVWSIVVNALVLWTVPLLMIIGGFAAIAAFIFTPLAKLFLYLCLPFLMYFEFITNFFANLKGSFTFQNVPWQLSVGYYFLLISLLTFFFKKQHD